VFSSFFKKIFNWAQSRSLWVLHVHHGCCADEVMNVCGPRYDIERFGCVMVTDPTQADVLLVSGCVSFKAAPYLKSLYDQMRSPKFVMAMGSCACSGGFFAESSSHLILPGIHQLIPVDVFVSGCPPRPEAIMNGLLALQGKICGE
jgi:NADH-quinone oxidoreductase subunit B